MIGAAAQAISQTYKAEANTPAGDCPFPDGPDSGDRNDPNNPNAPGDSNNPGGSAGGGSGPGGGGAGAFVPPGGNPLSPPRDPLVIDLNGGGFDFVSAGASTAMFDLDLDGFAERTGWIATGAALVVHDSNANGLVDGAGELIGSPGVDGFSALAGLDQNGDGRVGNSDAAYANLKVWTNTDGDGVADFEELKKLSDLGIASLSVAATASGEVLQGNVVGYTGTASNTDGSTLTLGSAYFATDGLVTEWIPPEGFVRADARAAFALRRNSAASSRARCNAFINARCFARGGRGRGAVRTTLELIVPSPLVVLPCLKKWKRPASVLNQAAAKLGKRRD